MNNRQHQFGNHSYAPLNKRGLANTAQRIETVLYNAGDQVQLINFDLVRTPLVLVISLVKEPYHSNDAAWVKHLRKLLKGKGEPPGNFWEFVILNRPDRVQTMFSRLKRMNFWLVKNGYYSPSFRPILRQYNIRNSNKDGVSKANLILSEDEISIVCNTVVPNWRNEAEAYLMQAALDILAMSIFYGARKNDVRSIIKSMDSSGNPVARLGNEKSRKIQSITWHPLTDAAYQRGLYASTKPVMFHDRALRQALCKFLPQTSNWLVKYTVNRPATGRVQLNDYRLNHFTFHVGRHTACTRWLRMGLLPNVVMRLMGHTSIVTTIAYYDWMTDDEGNEALRIAYGLGKAKQAKAHVIPTKRTFGQHIEMPQISLAPLKFRQPTKGKGKVVVLRSKRQEKQEKQENLLRVIAEINKEDGANLQYGKEMHTVANRQKND